MDEEYFACLLECIIAGSTEPEKILRKGIARTLSARPAIKTMLEKAKIENELGIQFQFEKERIEKVVIKIARALSLYELSVPNTEQPTVTMIPLCLLRSEQREEFESIDSGSFYPEVGSRALQRLFINDPNFKDGWIEVQKSNFRYAALPSSELRLVFREYLACIVSWEEI